MTEIPSLEFPGGELRRSQKNPSSVDQRSGARQLARALGAVEEPSKIWSSWAYRGANRSLKSEELEPPCG